MVRLIAKLRPLSGESAFVRELRHFHACITEDETCYTSLESARKDIALIIDIVKCYVQQETVICENE